MMINWGLVLDLDEVGFDSCNMFCAGATNKWSNIEGRYDYDYVPNLHSSIEHFI